MNAAPDPLTAPDRDPIVAIATPHGRGGIGIVRLSAPSLGVFLAGFFPVPPAPRSACYGAFLDAAGQVIDHGVALYFPAPASYTGEDVLELQAHGNPLLLDQLLARALELGARLARPGEFTLRAYLNGKLDLAQAEAVADLIDSASNQAIKAARRSLDGDFSRAVQSLADHLVRLRVEVEAALDFADEDLDLLAENTLRTRMEAIRGELDAVRRAAGQGRLLREGLTLVLAGRPNAGKSSLLNALSGHERAIVTPHPGTTRDTLHESIHLDGLPLRLIDTAGLRESQDPIEQEGIRRARAALERADRILFLSDDADPAPAEDRRLLAELPPAIPIIRIRNKIDRTGRPAGLEHDTDGPMLNLSIHDPNDIKRLRVHLKNSVGYAPEGDGAFSARRRHLDALDRAAYALDQAGEFARGDRLELLAEELRGASDALGEITGTVTPDDLLGRIFAEFCIGK